MKEIKNWSCVFSENSSTCVIQVFASSSLIFSPSFSPNSKISTTSQSVLHQRVKNLYIVLTFLFERSEAFLIF